MGHRPWNGGHQLYLLMRPRGPHFLQKWEENSTEVCTPTVGGSNPVNADDIYTVHSAPARDSGLCRRQGLVEFQAIFPHPPNSASITHPLRVVCVFAKGGEIHPWLSLLPPSSRPPFATRKSSAVYSQQGRRREGFLGRMHITQALLLAGSLREMP